MLHTFYERCIEQLDIRRGDCLLVSSDITRMMLAARKNGENFSPARFIEALMAAVGTEGTLLFPTYNWGFCKGNPFNYRETPCMTGSLGKEALKKDGFRRTEHPIYSFAVWGKDQEYLCSMQNTRSFGKDSPFAYLHQHGKSLVMDVALKNCLTFAHYVEECIGVTYRYQKTFTAVYIDEAGEEESRSYSMLVRDLDKNVETIIDPIGEDMKRDGKLNGTTIDGIPFSTFLFSDFYEYARRDILENKARKLARYDGQEKDIGGEMYALAERLFPICRSITGEGTRRTLDALKEIVPQMTIHEVPTGTQVFDWSVPREWVIRDAYIEDSSGNRILSFAENNLHVLGYSMPLDKMLSREDLLKIVYTQPDQPDVIPYVTSYYKERSGFCMSENQKQSLQGGTYHAVIDSELKDGKLTYGEILIPGQSDEEVFFSTYVCHPSMANNELSGPCVSIHLAKRIQEQKRKYSYRFVFIPETIGSIAYLSKHMEWMKAKTIAGFNISCVGDDRTYSYVESRYGDTYADRIAQNVLSFHYPNYMRYSFLSRGSDERQYCAPGVDLPVCTICRSKYGAYPEYHTSADNMDLISPRGLFGAFDVLWQCIETVEHNNHYRINCFCEPQLGKRGLYPTISQKGGYSSVTTMMDLIAYCDGTNDIIDISNRIGAPVKELLPVIQKLKDSGLLKQNM